MNNITAIIIDDERMARILLEGIIKSHCPEIVIIGMYSNLREGVKSIQKNKPNLVFLDIEMPGYSGLDILDFFNPSDINFNIIFTTAYNQYAIKAFKLSAIDYILKPLEPDAIKDAVNRYQNSIKSASNLAVLKDNLMQNVNSKKIAIHGINVIHFIKLEEISYFKAEGAYTYVVLVNGQKLLASKSLKHFENSLEGQTNFVRCHKSYIVNINDVSSYVKSEGGRLIMSQLDEVNISQDKIKEVLSILNV